MKLNFAEKGKVNIAFLVYDQIEAMDLNGPLDVFTKANRENQACNIYTVAESSLPIACEGNTIVMQPGYSFHNAPGADILIIPGAPMDAVLAVAQNSNVTDWIREQDKKTQITMSVCSGAFILSAAGLLNGKSATTHHLAISALAQNPCINVISKRRFVADGKLITTAGITSGIDGALYVIEMMYGKKKADEIAQLMVYDRSGNMSFIP